MRGTVWTRLRLEAGRRPYLADLVLAGSVLAAGVALGHQDPGGGFRPFDPAGYALTCVLSLALVARRRAPVLVLVGYVALWAGYVTAGYWPVVNSPGAMLALYTVASLRPPRVTAAAATLTGLLWMYAGLRGGDNAVATIVAQSIAWPAALCYVGSGTRRLAEQGRQLARQAVTEERIRIARELHDVVAHHMSVISVQAGLARYVLESDPATAAGALDTVLGSGAEGLDELRRMLAVLRMEPDDGEPYDPSPGLARLEELAERIRAAGVPVELVVRGDRRPLTPGVDLCAFRVVQESLTNVLKHAGPARATVTVRYEPDRLVVTVTDDGRTPPNGGTGGHGLVGMAERARLYGGTLTTGPRAGGGFEVVLAIPAGGGG